MAILVILIVTVSIMIRRLIVYPLISYNESIRKDEIFPVIGAAELPNRRYFDKLLKIYEDGQSSFALILLDADFINMSFKCSDGQHKCDCAACFAAFQHLYGSPVLFGNRVNQRQSQSGTAHSPAAGLVYTEKRIKDFFLIFR